MKTLDLIFKGLAGLVLVVLFTACGKSDGNSNGANYYNPNYYMRNNQCVQRNTGQVVPNSYCQNNNNCYNQNGIYNNNYGYNNYGGYNNNYYGNGYNNNLYGNGYNQNCGGYNNGGGYQQCFGIYYRQTYNGPIQVNCNGANCRNVQLMDQYGQMVYCM